MRYRTLAISIASLIALLVLFRLSGVRVPMMGFPLAVAAGFLVGGQTGVRLPGWTFFAVGVLGAVALVAGLWQYEDDTPCCSTSLVVLIVIAIGLFLGLAFMTGLAFGAASGSRDNRRR